MTGGEPSYWASAPSNIAFLKYWGKRDAVRQWPMNDSLSMTLSHALTRTEVLRIAGDVDDVQLSLGVTGGRDAATKIAKVIRQLEIIRADLGVTQSLRIRSHNLFPTGCGIASSASSASALSIAAAMALTQSESFKDLEARGITRNRLSHWARLGSGSASRSLWGGYVHWQAGQSAEDQRVLPFACDWRLADVIVIVDPTEKTISSRDGHRAAATSPLMPVRQSGIAERLEIMQAALTERNIAKLGQALEAEALEMHAVAMTGEPPVRYLSEATTSFIAALREERQSSKLAAYFTIDAGPNVHVICELSERARVSAWIERAFPDVRVLHDETGAGPRAGYGLSSVEETLQ